MHIDYEISEQDFLHGWHTAMMPRDESFKTRILFPAACALASLLFIYISLFSSKPTPGHSIQVRPVSLVVGLVFILLACSKPILLAVIRQRTNPTVMQMYRSSPNVSGRLSLDTNEEGINFTGPAYALKANWPQFTRFTEDRRFFVLYQRNPEPGAAPFLFHIVPKRGLSSDEIAGLRRYLEQNIGAKK